MTIRRNSFGWNGNRCPAEVELWIAIVGQRMMDIVRPGLTKYGENCMAARRAKLFFKNGCHIPILDMIGYDHELFEYYLATIIYER